MIDTAKTYMLAVLTVAAALFIAAFKYRGFKIERQEEKIDEQASKLQAVEQYHEAKDKAQEFEAGNRVEASKAEAEDYKDIKDGIHTI